MLPQKRFIALFLFSLSVCTCVRNVDWCQYFRLLKRDHTRPECNGIFRIRMTKRRDDPFSQLPPLQREFLASYQRFREQRAFVTELTRKALGIRNCSWPMARCRDSKLCGFGLLCDSNEGYCCLEEALHPL